MIDVWLNAIRKRTLCPHCREQMNEAGCAVLVNKSHVTILYDAKCTNIRCTIKPERKFTYSVPNECAAKIVSKCIRAEALDPHKAYQIDELLTHMKVNMSGTERDEIRQLLCEAMVQ